MALGELVSAAALIGFPLFTLFHDTGMRTEQKCSHSKYKASATPQALFGRANKHCLFGRGKNVAFRDNSTDAALNHEIGRIYRQAYCGRLQPRAQIRTQRIVFNCHEAHFLRDNNLRCGWFKYTLAGAMFGSCQLLD